MLRAFFGDYSSASDAGAAGGNYSSSSSPPSSSLFGPRDGLRALRAADVVNLPSHLRLLRSQLALLHPQSAYSLPSSSAPPHSHSLDVVLRVVEQICRRPELQRLLMHEPDTDDDEEEVMHDEAAAAASSSAASGPVSAVRMRARSSGPSPRSPAAEFGATCISMEREEMMPHYDRPRVRQIRKVRYTRVDGEPEYLVAWHAGTNGEPADDDSWELTATLLKDPRPQEAATVARLLAQADAAQTHDHDNVASAAAAAPGPTVPSSAAHRHPLFRPMSQAIDFRMPAPRELVGAELHDIMSQLAVPEDDRIAFGAEMTLWERCLPPTPVMTRLPVADVTYHELPSYLAALHSFVIVHGAPLHHMSAVFRVAEHFVAVYHRELTQKHAVAIQQRNDYRYREERRAAQADPDIQITGARGHAVGTKRSAAASAAGHRSRR